MPAPPHLLHPGEVVAVDVHPHWLFLSGPAVVTAVVVAAAVGVELGIPREPSVLHWVEGAAAAVPLCWLAVRVVRWRLRHLVVTSERIIELRGVGRHRPAEVGLGEIERVDAVVSLPRRLVGAGSLVLVLWGDDVARVLEDVRHPEVLARVISRRLPHRSG
ncbi:MAG: hypothetical protein M0032_10390 [Actinomycetota bacterium]|nr:hypothetical protein [Actinomycetota bacterium]